MKPLSFRQGNMTFYLHVFLPYPSQALQWLVDVGEEVHYNWEKTLFERKHAMATIKDIAKHAGVSVTTVSRAFNNRGYIAEATRKKIEEACLALNYQPNELARSLFRKKSNMIGVMIPRLDSYFFSDLIQRIEAHLYAAGYKIMVCSTNGNLEKEKSYFSTFQAHKVDGVIIASYLSETSFDYSGLPMPAVAFDRVLSDAIPCIGSDHEAIGRLATQALLDGGCKRLVHVSGDSGITSPAHGKTQAFIDLCQTAGVTYGVIEKPMTGLADDQVSGINLNLNKLFDQAMGKVPSFDGIFLSDEDACAFLRYAKAKNIRIPDDVQVIGYDNLAIGTMVTPALTTVAQDRDAISRQLVDTLLGCLATDSETGSAPMGQAEKIPVHLIQRNSSKS